MAISLISPGFNETIRSNVQFPASKWGSDPPQQGTSKQNGIAISHEKQETESRGGWQ